MNEETSPGENRIFRQAESSSSRPREPEDRIDMFEEIEAHLDRFFGGADRVVLHGTASDLIELDVHVIAPSDGFPFQRLVTNGMSSHPMTMPDGFDRPPSAELTIALPADWPVPEDGAPPWDAASGERAYWPIRLLETLTRLPREHSTFLWPSHTIPNGDPPDPYADDTELCGALIIDPFSSPEGFSELRLPDGRTVSFFGVLPIHDDEMELARSKGFDALADLLARNEITDVLDKDRPSVVPRRRRLFGR
ncbi:MAG TPA: suppressor of fused domain protein [Gaiellaceae bacterium]